MRFDMKNEDQFKLIVKVINEAVDVDPSWPIAINLLDDFFNDRPMELTERADWGLFKRFALEHSDSMIMMNISLWIEKADILAELMPEEGFYQYPNPNPIKKVNRILKRKKSGEFYYE